ncbi:maleylacetoacetate isomerase [Sphingomonas sp. RS2018]
MTLRLHGYWRSGTSYRTRIALGLKGLAYEQIDIDLRTGAQGSDAFRALNPQGLVPALETSDTVLTQSPAILEWLDETYPDPPLLPAQADARAIVRAMAAAIACDIHPLNNLRVLKLLRADFAMTAEQEAAWAARWITDGFAALEKLVAQHGRGFAFGDAPTLADCYLVPQIYTAHRFGVDLSPYPRLVAAGERMEAIPAVAAAHPSRQPAADPA